MNHKEKLNNIKDEFARLKELVKIDNKLIHLMNVHPHVFDVYVYVYLCFHLHYHYRLYVYVYVFLFFLFCDDIFTCKESMQVNRN